MARILVAASLLTLFASVPAHADPEPSEDVVREAERASVDPIALQGALNSEETDAGRVLDPCIWLLRNAEVDGCIGTALMITKSEPPPLSGRLACIAWQESRNNPNATNRSSGAMGLFQFLPSTWRTTPQGKAGLSAYNAAAATAAAQWMIGQGRVREWAVVTAGLCP